MQIAIQTGDHYVRAIVPYRIIDSLHRPLFRFSNEGIENLDAGFAIKTMQTAIVHRRQNSGQIDEFVRLKNAFFDILVFVSVDFMTDFGNDSLLFFREWFICAVFSGDFGDHCALVLDGIIGVVEIPPFQMGHIPHFVRFFIGVGLRRFRGFRQFRRFRRFHQISDIHNFHGIRRFHRPIHIQ
jgi:hypothetical protein